MHSYSYPIPLIHVRERKKRNMYQECSNFSPLSCYHCTLNAKGKRNPIIKKTPSVPCDSSAVPKLHHSLTQLKNSLKDTPTVKSLTPQPAFNPPASASPPPTQAASSRTLPGSPTRPA